MFKVPNPFDELVKKTTSEMLTTENWELIMEVCDRVGTDTERAHQCFEVINERLLHRNANVVLYTLTLVNSMIDNCGQSVRQEVSSRAFTTTLTRILNDKSVHEKVKSRVLGSIQQWAFDFRQDPTLSLMEETYTKLRAQRFLFPSPQKPEKIPKQSDIERQKEEDDLQLALALSLSSVGDAQGAEKANYQSPAAIRSEITRKQTVAVASGQSGTGSVTRRTTRAQNPAAAPVANAATAAAPAGDAAAAKRKVQVKALFDFVPTEPGELGFYKGDVIDVLDQKYRDWWKGELRGKHGIFPANFVQPLGDIRADVAKDMDAEVQVFSEAHNIEALLRMLGSVDPLKSNVSDNPEIQRLYSSTWELRPKIIKMIEKYNKKKEELVSLDAQLSKSMRLYDELMQRSVSQTANYGSQPPQQQFAGYSGAAMAYSQPMMVPQQLAVSHIPGQPIPVSQPMQQPMQQQMRPQQQVPGQQVPGQQAPGQHIPGQQLPGQQPMQQQQQQMRPQQMPPPQQQIRPQQQQQPHNQQHLQAAMGPPQGYQPAQQMYYPQQQQQPQQQQRPPQNQQPQQPQQQYPQQAYQQQQQPQFQS